MLLTHCYNHTLMMRTSYVKAQVSILLHTYVCETRGQLINNLCVTNLCVTHESSMCVCYFVAELYRICNLSGSMSGHNE